MKPTKIEEVVEKLRSAHVGVAHAKEAVLSARALYEDARDTEARLEKMLYEAQTELLTLVQMTSKETFLNPNSK